LYHGPKELGVRIDVCKDSTAKGDLLPPPWSKGGDISEVYLSKGSKFEEISWKGAATKSTVPKDTSSLGTYLQNLSVSDQEVKQLHLTHILKDSKSINFDALLHLMGPDETLIAKVACKALINAPATGYDIVNDIVVAMTRMKSDSAPGGYQRRIYFFHVR
jgi:hypothetical protein